MIRFRFNWRKSKAHLLLLSKFTRPRTVDDFDDATWKPVLGESVAKAVKQFIKDGMVTQGDVCHVLDYRFTVAQLKEMLRKRGLPVSGKKQMLIKRLVEADENLVRRYSGDNVLICTEEGKALVQEYLEEERRKREEAERVVMEHLVHRRFKKAAIVVASYEANQVFPRGIGIDWKKYKPNNDVEVLKLIFSKRPKILRTLSDQDLETLRVAAGMMYLWGTRKIKPDWLPHDFTIEGTMDVHVAARMLLFHAGHLREISAYRKMGISKVRVLAADNSCEACKRIAGRVYSLDTVPELPCEHCTNKVGCRCTLAPAAELEDLLGAYTL